MWDPIKGVAALAFVIVCLNLGWPMGAVLFAGGVLVNAVIYRLLKRHYYNAGCVPTERRVTVHDHKRGRIYTQHQYYVGRVEIGRNEYENYWGARQQRVDYSAVSAALLAELSVSVEARLAGADPDVRAFAERLLGLAEGAMLSRGDHGLRVQSPDTATGNAVLILNLAPKKCFADDPSGWRDWFAGFSDKDLSTLFGGDSAT